MQLVPGTRVGAYEITAPIGAGGMGEVYRARDTRLNRTVAVKILSKLSSGEEEHRLRFKREAHAVAALNHPHVCTLHDVGEEAGLSYLVMEFVDGQTLDQRLRNGPMPVAEALTSAIAIADALSHAHAAGIIHRDLKPGNIMLTKNGVKVLDFGLAKSSGITGNPQSSLATRTQTVTAQGMLVGTLQYMAPEQLEGCGADTRSDIFAFGAVLYEMLTGYRAFEGVSAASLINSIMSGAPRPASSLQPLLPAALDRTVTKCLFKDPDARWQTMADLRDELEWIAHTPPVRPSDHPTRPSRGNVWQLVGVLMAILAIVLLPLLWLSAKQSTYASTVRFTVTPPFGPLSGRFFPAQLSPDGKTLAFVAPDQTGGRRIWTRPVDDLTATPLRGTEEATYVFWSPDSRYIGFTDLSQLKKISLDSGMVQPIARYKGLIAGATWGSSGTIITGSASSRLFRVPATGGDLTELRVSEERFLMYDPQFLPDESSFLYNATPNTNGPTSLFVASLDGKPVRKLMEADSQAQLLRIPSGRLFGGTDDYLIFRSGTKTMFQQFDTRNASLVGNPAALRERIRARHSSAFIFATFSPAGAMLYQTGSEKSPGIGLWDAKGVNVRDLGRPGEHYSPAFSPDGQHLVVGWRESDHSANQDLWTYDLGRSAWVRTTTDPEWDGSPIWSPDGREMAYSSLRGGVPAIYVQSPLTASPPRRITQDKLSRHPTDWSPDGKFLLVTDESNVASSGPDQALLPLDGSASIRINPTPFSERHGRFLPTDGTWIAYTSNESGRDQVYVQSTVRPTKIQISNNGGSQPRFRHDGRELYYLAPTNEIMAVSISSGPVIRASEPRILFRAPGTRTLSFGNSYDVSRDGRQFVFSYVPPDEAPNDFNVVLNWRPR